MKNNCLIYEDQSIKKNQFYYEMTIGPNALVFTQSGDTFDLRINNESFHYAYNRLKQQDHFVYENQEDHNDPYSRARKEEIQREEQKQAQ